MRRKGHTPPARADAYAGLDGIERYRCQSADAERHRREEFRRTLGDDQRFEHVASLFKLLKPLAREKLVPKDSPFRAIERSRSMAELWVWLGVGVAMKNGRKDPWRDDYNRAVKGIADAVSNLREVVGSRFPAFLEAGPIRDCLDSLTVSQQPLLALFPPRPRAKPVSEWLHQTLHLLRHWGGVSRTQAEELVRAAGLNTNYPEERRQRRKPLGTGQKAPRNHGR